MISFNICKLYAIFFVFLSFFMHWHLPYSFYSSNSCHSNNSIVTIPEGRNLRSAFLRPDGSAHKSSGHLARPRTLNFNLEPLVGEVPFFVSPLRPQKEPGKLPHSFQYLLNHISSPAYRIFFPSTVQTIICISFTNE